MKIIDFHTHIYPDKIAVRGSQSICDFYGIGYRNTGSADVLLGEGKRVGISEFVILPVAVKAEHAQSINDFTVSEVKAHKEFYGFGTVHAKMKDIAAETERIISLGLKGIKIHPDMQRFNIDDKRLYPMYEIIRGKMPIVIHCGDPRYDFSDSARLRRVIDDFSDLCVVGAHLGGWLMFDKALEYLKDTNCFFDISSSMMFIGADAALKYIRSYGADRILFGTDFPSWNMPKQVGSFIALDLTDDEREKIAHLNAERLLGV